MFFAYKKRRREYVSKSVYALPEVNSHIQKKNSLTVCNHHQPQYTTINHYLKDLNPDADNMQRKRFDSLDA